MEKEILFENNEQKEATERVLAAVRIKTINKELDELLSEIVQYSGNIDKILERNNLAPRYLERLGVLENMTELSLDDDLGDIDFRVKEIVEDLINRINTRINLVENNKVVIDELTTSYNVVDDKIVNDIELSKLSKLNFDETLNA